MTLFSRSTRGLLDSLLSALCLWAACYHTPVGALCRTVGGRLLGVKTAARPLLTYYSGGVYDEHQGADSSASLPEVHAAVPPAEALGFGAYAAMNDLPAEARERAAAFAMAGGVSRAALGDPRLGPHELARMLRAASERLGSDEAAVAALFWGEETERYARDRALASHDRPDIESMARQLPPGYGDLVASASRAVTLGTVYALAWPVGDQVRITSPFGMRLHPVLGYRKMHTGVDLGVPEGTPVLAVAEGTVKRASEDLINGRVLIVDHGRGVTSAYCHNDELLVKLGDRIRRGQVIAHSGNTGRSTGAHLHYQLDLGGTPVDPLRYRVSHAPRGDLSGSPARD